MPILGAALDTNVPLSVIAYPGSVPDKLMAAWRQGSLKACFQAMRSTNPVFVDRSINRSRSLSGPA
jgi:hypothetical protein